MCLSRWKMPWQVMNNSAIHGCLVSINDQSQWDPPVVIHISCPFCGSPDIPARPGKAFCHNCQYHFFMDDRVECVFADPKNLRSPLIGAWISGTPHTFTVYSVYCSWYMDVMPRKSRIDAPGALHHIIVRGIERRKIFVDDMDRNNFLDKED